MKKESENWLKKHPVWSVIIGLFVLGFIGNIFSSGDNNEPTGYTIEEENEIQESYKLDNMMACIMSQNFVEDRLKAPATAEFSSCALSSGERTSSGETTVKYIENRTYEVYGYVDAQNSFGVMIRTDYYVMLRDDEEEDLWIAKDVRLYE